MLFRSDGNDDKDEDGQVFAEYLVHGTLPNGLLAGSWEGSALPRPIAYYLNINCPKGPF